jgi:hypothetical protein
MNGILFHTECCYKLRNQFAVCASISNLCPNKAYPLVGSFQEVHSKSSKWARWQSADCIPKAQVVSLQRRACPPTWATAEQTYVSFLPLSTFLEQSRPKSDIRAHLNQTETNSGQLRPASVQHTLCYKDNSGANSRLPHCTECSRCFIGTCESLWQTFRTVQLKILCSSVNYCSIGIVTLLSGWSLRLFCANAALTNRKTSLIKIVASTRLSLVTLYLLSSLSEQCLAFLSIFRSIIEQATGC